MNRMSFPVLWQGLLKVALDNARIQEKQIQQEKRELQMELYREREIRENLERQLAVELQSRSKFNKLSVTEKVNIVLEIFSVVIEIFSDIAWNCWKGHNHDKIKSHTDQVDDPQTGEQ